MSKRVYKFLSAENALCNIERRRIKVSTIDDLNDPFDLAAVDSTEPAIEKALSELVPLLRTKGLLCFSQNWNNLLLWSHYGRSHTGICLGFDIPDSQADGSPHTEVSYQPNLLKVESPSDVNLEFAKSLLRTKYEIWSYEQEVRLFVQLNDPPDEKGMSWFPFGEDLKLKDVIVGAQCSGEHIKKILDIRQHCTDDVDFSWAGLRKDAFLLVRMASPPPWQA